MFDLSNYRTGSLESAVVDFYRKNKIMNPQDITLDIFAEDANIRIRYLPRSSVTYAMKDIYIVVIDDRLDPLEQRVQLAHELGHVLHDVGRQEFMQDDLKAQQEWRADRFAMYALVPTFMMANCWVQASSRNQLVSQLAYHFDVPEPFMDARLELLEQRLYAISVENQMATAIQEAAAGYDYSYRHPTNPRIEYLVKDHEIIGRRLRSDI